MTPEAKAAELIDKFSKISLWVVGEGFVSLGDKAGKQCALACVKELICVAWWTSAEEMPEPYRKSQKQYWEDVLLWVENS